MASTFKNDSVLWYNVPTWGDLGLAVPNFGNDVDTLNSTILYLTQVTGRNLQAVMAHPDADLRTPPSINTLIRIHKLCTRARQILAGRKVDPGTPNMESVHVMPGPEVFLVYPTPFFKARNYWLKEYAGLILTALSEAMQHTENRRPIEISRDFAGLMGQYFHRVYKLMATELFQVPAEAASALDFTLTDEQIKSYDPSKFFTSTELIDVVPPHSNVPTEDDLEPLSQGIPVTQLPPLGRYPMAPSTASGPSASGPAPSVSFSPAPTI